MQGRREWTEMKWWRDKKLLKTKWLNTNGELVYKTVINCTQIMK